MTIGMIFGVLKQMGLLNIVGILFVVNLPSISYNTYLWVKHRKEIEDAKGDIYDHVGNKYLLKEVYEKDTTRLGKQVEELKDGITALRKAITDLSNSIMEQKTTSAVQNERISSLMVGRDRTPT